MEHSELPEAGSYRGVATIRSFLEHYLESWEDFHQEIEDRIVRGPCVLLFIQLDGVPFPVLRWAVQSGAVPTIRRWLANGDYELREWTPQLPCTTPASQLGILHGTVDRVPAFRWYDLDLGRVLALALQKAEALSVTDDLTQLYNSRYLSQVLRRETKRASRSGRPLSLLFIDLDGFKAINDELGHPRGDLVLVTFADRLRSVLRASDTAARLGGDEFSIVCENTEPADAEVLADRLREAVTEPLSLSGTNVSVGISIGIGSAPGGDEPGDVYERVVREADDAMYVDKARRR